MPEVKVRVLGAANAGQHDIAICSARAVADSLRLHLPVAFGLVREYLGESQARTIMDSKSNSKQTG